jgi:hypothetical protein
MKEIRKGMQQLQSDFPLIRQQIAAYCGDNKQNCKTETGLIELFSSARLAGEGLNKKTILKIMMKIFIAFVVVLSQNFSELCAQVFIEVGPVQNNRDAFSSVVVYGSDGLRCTIPYEEIRGSAFWKSEWSKAYFYDQRDTLLGSYRARFNAVNNEVHFLDKDGVEKAIIPGTLNKVVFMQDADSTAIATVFRDNIPEIDKQATCKTCYVQELNQGNVKLMKITRRLVKAKDSLFGTVKKFYFEDQVEYFLQYKEKYERIKKLNRDNVFSFLPNTSAFAAWISEHKLRFEKEADVVLFLNYYNTARRNDLP